MRRRAVARGRVVQDAGRPLGTSDQVLHRADAGGRIHCDDQRRAADLEDRHQVARRVPQFGIEHRVHQDTARARNQDRVAVRRRLGHLVGRDAGAAARPVLDHDRLAQGLAERIAHGAGDIVGGAARREADHQLHRFVGIGRGLGPGAGALSAQRCQQQRPDPVASLHRVSLHCHGRVRLRAW